MMRNTGTQVSCHWIDLGKSRLDSFVFLRGWNLQHWYCIVKSNLFSWVMWLGKNEVFRCDKNFAKLALGFFKTEAKTARVGVNSVSLNIGFNWFWLKYLPALPVLKIQSGSFTMPINAGVFLFVSYFPSCKWNIELKKCLPVVAKIASQLGQLIL